MKSAPTLLSAVTAPSTLWAAPSPPPLLNSNWKALLSPACWYQHGQGSRRLKPRRSFEAIPRAVWWWWPPVSVLTCDIWADQPTGSHLARATLPATIPKLSLAKCSTATLKSSYRSGDAVFPLGQQLFSLKSRGSCPLPQGPAKERAGALSLPPQISAIKFQPTSVMREWIFPSQFFPPVEMGVNLTCQF